MDAAEVSVWLFWRGSKRFNQRPSASPRKHSWASAAISPRPICTTVYFNLTSSMEPSRPQNKRNTYKQTHRARIVFANLPTTFSYLPQKHISGFQSRINITFVGLRWFNKRPHEGSALLTPLNVKWLSETDRWSRRVPGIKWTKNSLSPYECERGQK